MTNEEILKRAIEKANKNGLNWTIIPKMWIDSKAYYAIIFDHDFAKAFWGENYYLCHGDSTIPVTNRDIYENLSSKPKNLDNLILLWQFYLQQMVVSPDPLKYLEKFL